MSEWGADGTSPSEQAERPRNPFSSAPPVGDFFAPFFTVEFTNHEKQGKVQGSGGETLYKFSDGPQLRSFASSLEVVNVGDGMCTATLTLEPPYYEAVHIVEAKVIRRNSIMSCQWGYLPGGSGSKAIVSRVHHFTLTDTPRVDVAGTDVSITIVGVDTFSNAAMQREDRTAYARNKSAYDKKQEATEAKTEHKGTRGSGSATGGSATGGGNGATGATDAGATTVGAVGADGAEAGGGSAAKDHHMQEGVFETDLKILEHLVAKVGMTVNTSLVPASSQLLKERPLEGEEDVLEQDKLDWAFFIALCKSNGCNFFTEGGVVYLVDTNYMKVQQTSYRLLLMQQPETDRDIPMLAFSTNALENLFSTPEAVEVRGVSVDMDSGTVVDLTIDPAATDTQEFLGKLTNAGRQLASGREIKLSDDTSLIPAPGFSATETGRHVPIPHGQENRDKHVEQLTREGAFAVNTDAQATIPGVPSLIPLMLVEVSAGFPTTFDGPYIAMKATHRIGTDGYDMELALQRDTTSASAEGAGTRPATGGNTPDQQSSGAEGVGSVDADGKKT